MEDWNLERIADRLLDAACDPTLWTETLHEIGCGVGGAGALLVSTDVRLPGLPSSPGLEACTAQYFAEGWHQRDERFGAMPLLLRDGIAVDQQFVESDVMRQSPYYQEFLAPHGLRWFAGLGFMLDGELWCLSIQRTIEQGAFQADEIERLSGLLKPLHHAADLSRRLGFARVLGMRDALEQLGQPGLLLNRKGRILAMNAPAGSAIGDLVDTHENTLAFGDARSRTSFASILRAAIEIVPKRSCPTVACVRDQRGNTRVLRAIGLRGFAKYTFAEASVLVLLEDIRGRHLDPGALLRTAFALTLGESRVALELGTGVALTRAAENLGITYERARADLKGIFTKTGTDRQSELVTLVTRFSDDASKPT